MGTTCAIYKKYELNVSNYRWELVPNDLEQFNNNTNPNGLEELNDNTNPNNLTGINMIQLAELNNILIELQNNARDFPQPAGLTENNINILKKINSLYPLELAEYIKTNEWIDMVNSVQWNERMLLLTGLPIIYLNFSLDIETLASDGQPERPDYSERFHRITKLYLLNVKVFNTRMGYYKRELEDSERYEKEYMEYMKVTKITQWIHFNYQKLKDIQIVGSCLLAWILICIILVSVIIYIINKSQKRMSKEKYERLIKPRYERFIKLRKILWKIFIIVIIICSIYCIVFEFYIEKQRDKMDNDFFKHDKAIWSGEISSQL